MNWLWIPTVALLSIFFIALCWYFFSDYTCCPCRKKRYPVALLPTTVSLQPPAVPKPLVPSAPPVVTDDSPVVRLTLGPKKLWDIVYEENGIPTLDLHGMTVLEARSATQGFIQRQRILGSSHMQIITGRGIHSVDGKPKIKPAIMNVLITEDLSYRETSQGGAYLVYL